MNIIQMLKVDLLARSERLLSTIDEMASALEVKEAVIGGNLSTQVQKEVMIGF